MSIASDVIRGHTDAIILAQLMSEDSYGYKINRAVVEKTQGLFEFKEATLYTAFRRLEQSGYITSYWGDENTGARRRYYSITPYGVEQYNRMVAQWEESVGLLQRLIYPQKHS